MRYIIHFIFKFNCLIFIYLFIYLFIYSGNIILNANQKNLLNYMGSLKIQKLQTIWQYWIMQVMEI